MRLVILAIFVVASCAKSASSDFGEDGGRALAGEGEGASADGGVGEGEGASSAGEGEGAQSGEGEGARSSEGEGEGEGTSAQFGPYDADGPDSVSTATLDVTTDTGHTFQLLAFLPSSPGAHPVVSLSPGLLQKAVAYTTFGTRLASWGIVVVARDDPGVLTQSTDVTADIVYVVSTFLPQQNEDSTSPLFGALDLDHVGLAGHSRGGKASLIAAEHGLHGVVHAWFGLDPVDASTLADNTFAVTDIASVGIPLAFLGASVSSSCSPADSNSSVLFAHAVSPAVQLIGIGAGHTQLEDQDQCTACFACTPSGSADPDVVLRYAARYLTAYFARELLGDSSVGATFAGAGVNDDVAAGLIELHSK